MENKKTSGEWRNKNRSTDRLKDAGESGSRECGPVSLKGRSRRTTARVEVPGLATKNKGEPTRPLSQQAVPAVKVLAGIPVALSGAIPDNPPKMRSVNCEACVQHPRLKCGMGVARARRNPDLYRLCSLCNGTGTVLIGAPNAGLDRLAEAVV